MKTNFIQKSNHPIQYLCGKKIIFYPLTNEKVILKFNNKRYFFHLIFKKNNDKKQYKNNKLIDQLMTSDLFE